MAYNPELESEAVIRAHEQAALASAATGLNIEQKRIAERNESEKLRKRIEALEGAFAAGADLELVLKILKDVNSRTAALETEIAELREWKEQQSNPSSKAGRAKS